MELAEVMTTAFSCREFTDEPVSDADIEAMMALARFAPSGGNRQPWRVVAVRDGATKTALRRAAEPAMRVYMAQVAAGEAPWNTIVPTSVDVEERWNADDPVEFLAFLEAAPVLLCVGVDLSVVASFDSRLDRVGVISGASIYPFVWNLLLAARDRGLAGALTTMCVGEEAAAQEALGFPSHVALAAVLPIGHPRRRLTKLSRLPVDDLLRYERWDDGEA
ncbi:MAG: nitroreductase family protein [Acidimicrobiales bacterium]